jgi:hypothetical protein
MRIVEEFRRRAAHCDQAAAQAEDIDAKLFFAAAAEQWRKLADRIKLPDRQIQTERISDWPGPGRFGPLRPNPQGSEEAVSISDFGRAEP